MKTVTRQLLKQKNEVQAPTFPDACCYCGNSVHDTIQVGVGRVKLSVPYCEEHFAPASEYINEVIPRVGKINVIIGVVGGLMFAFAMPMLLEISSLALQIVVGIVSFVVGIFMLAIGGPMHTWSGLMLKRGAQKLGFIGLARVAPGIVAGSATVEPESGKVRLKLSFANDSYADLFEVEQQATKQDLAV